MVLTYVVVILVGLVIRASFIVWSCDHMCGCCGRCLACCNRDDNRVLMCSVVVVCLVVILLIRVLAANLYACQSCKWPHTNTPDSCVLCYSRVCYGVHVCVCVAV